MFAVHKSNPAAEQAEAPRRVRNLTRRHRREFRRRVRDPTPRRRQRPLHGLKLFDRALVRGVEEGRRADSRSGIRDKPWARGLRFPNSATQLRPGRLAPCSDRRHGTPDQSAESQLVPSSGTALSTTCELGRSCSRRFQNALSDLQAIQGDLQGIQGDLQGIRDHLHHPGPPVIRVISHRMDFYMADSLAMLRRWLTNSEVAASASPTMSTATRPTTRPAPLSMVSAGHSTHSKLALAHR